MESFPLPIMVVMMFHRDKSKGYVIPDALRPPFPQCFAIVAPVHHRALAVAESATTSEAMTGELQ